MYKPVKSSLQGRTIDILNIIRNNASMEYQADIPTISDVADIPAVGAAICGNPSRSNEFINALINRIALVVANSAIFRNPYEMLKKGYLEYGESVEEIFVDLAKVVEYSAEKAADREFRRTLPDVHSVFHIMNWKVMYPVTIEREALKRAFLTADGVESLIRNVIDSIYTAAAYDEFLLVKYLIIKAVTRGEVRPVAVDTTDPDNMAISFRAASNAFTFLSTENNFAKVRNNAPKENQVIFMDSDVNAEYDVSVLAAAFNMDKADFMGRLLLIDSFKTFDNDRWATIVANSDMVEEVTSAELALMEDVIAVLADERWFQIYDEVSEMEDTKVSAGLYWNYFYHNWKIVSTSPFSNIVAFVSTTVRPISSLDFYVTAIVEGEDSTVYLLEADPDDAAIADQRYKFIQTQALTQDGVAVNGYGAVTVPAALFTSETALTLELAVGSATLEGTLQIVTDSSGQTAVPAVAVGDKITFAPGV